ncbi:MAG TPA: spermine synthase [Anaerolineae bacterium]|nr:spermine synthase [Anaerolineae bacterium]
MRKRMLPIAVFIAGLTTLGVELTASRLLGNVFGTSNLVWANIIGLILVYLSAGYFIGGRWADRSPFEATFYRLLSWAAFAAGLVPIVARPVLLGAASAVERLDAAVMGGSFIAVLVLFSVPVTLLGCVSPFAIRLAIKDTERAGRVAGRIYALSTLGSILGTFLPVLLLIPLIGTARTFLTLSLTLMAVGLTGLGLTDRRSLLLHLWMPLVLVALSWLTIGGPIKNTVGQIYETESAYNYIQVVERDGVRYLLLNEGQGIHSVYAPDQLATYGTWDYFLAAPFFSEAPVDPGTVERMGLVGLAAGTIAKQYTQVFGPIPIDGWEIDPEIIAVGREFFDMHEANLNAVAADGRWGLEHSPHGYNVVAVDAYRPPYIPWHLTTQEFFESVHAHLQPDGVIVINVGRTPEDLRLIEALVGTLSTVFPSVHVVDVPGAFNSIVYATVEPSSSENLVRNLEMLQERDDVHPLLIDVLRRTAENLQPTPETEIVFTDDKAPVEQLVNSIVLRYVLGSGMGLGPVIEP